MARTKPDLLIYTAHGIQSTFSWIGLECERPPIRIQSGLIQSTSIGGLESGMYGTGSGLNTSSLGRS